MAGTSDGAAEAPIRAAVNDPAYWRDCARRMRRDARAIRDPALKARLRAIAAMYMALARWTGRHAAPAGWIERLRYGRDGMTGTGAPQPGED